MSVTVAEEGSQVVIRMDFIEAIGLYKMTLGIDDEDSEHTSAALQVNLAAVVGP